ncbi:ABC transporter permease [Petroclostridium sp. X23]|uniref:ABC transporter permease n=1 Tax=Petroclostridium sp. X23 TaxID=3045146 RepID=UPI0024AE27C0|nr:ABC transporter permease [Petroclostridium sp. X23]WHH60823.1 ABC transporter permease [Petroclostridium sp. X23]
MNRNTKKIVMNVLPVLSIVLLILFWIWVSMDEKSLIPSPTEVIQRFIILLQHPISKTSIEKHIWASLSRVLSALVYASVIGISFGLLISWSKTFRALLKPLFEMMRPVPPIAWIPLITIWFGIDELSKIIIVFIGAVMPIVVNTYTGVTLVPELNLDAGRIFGANNRQLLLDIVLPSSIPAIVAGVKTALGTGWMVVLAAEMISAKTGLGFLIIRGSDSDDIALTMVSMIFIGLVGALLSTLLTLLERWLCPWRTDIN